MGTNYYVQFPKCRECGQKRDSIHLGKSSAGWQFSFAANGFKYYLNVKMMKEWLKGKKIVDEYDAPISYTAFWNMVKQKQHPHFRNHAEYCREKWANREGEYVIDGYSFSDCEFS